MSRHAIGLLAALAVFALASAGACLLSELLRMGSALVTLSAVRRSRLLWLLRLLPTGIALLATALAMLAYRRFEPNSDTETGGPILIVLAAAGGALLLRGALALVSGLRASWRFEREWRAQAG